MVIAAFTAQSARTDCLADDGARRALDYNASLGKQGKWPTISDYEKAAKAVAYCIPTTSAIRRLKLDAVAAEEYFYAGKEGVDYQARPCRTDCNSPSDISDETASITRGLNDLYEARKYFAPTNDLHALCAKGNWK